METLLIVIHLMVVLVLVGVILLQKSEGGGLDIGGNSGFMTARSTANTLTRATAILATIFFITSLGLSLLARYGEKPTDILDRTPTTTQGESQGKGVLDQLPGSTAPAPDASAPSVPTGTDGAAAPAPVAPAGEPASGSAAPAAGGTAAPTAPQVPNQ